MAKTILAVDDSGSLRQMVAFSLKAAGYDVVSAVDGQDGNLAKAKEKNGRPGVNGAKHANHGWPDLNQEPA